MGGDEGSIREKMRELVFSKESNLDVKDAIDFYETKQVGLGDHFFDKLQSKIEKLLHHPKVYAIRYEDIRFAKIDRFPFMIHFIENSEKIVVIGIIRTSRSPQSWKERKIK